MLLRVVFLFLLGVCYVKGKLLWRQPPFPSSGDALKKWGVSKVGRRENMKVVKDPAGGSTNVLRVLYKKGTYSGKKPGGIGFKATPFSALKSGLDSATLSYKVYFSPKFDFVRGGKLPGFYGGTGSCSGGRTEQCFSTRYMWRRQGEGEMYLYTPTSQASDFCKRKSVHCNAKYGNSIGRGTFKFRPGRWHTIQQYIKLNTPGKRNGVARIWFDGKAVYSVKDLSFRKTSKTKINAIMFSTFFGGSSADWATPKDVWTYYKDFEVWSHQPS